MYGSASSNVKGIDPAAMRLLAHYDWPGNVRELENCIRFSMLMAVGETMGVDDLPERLAESARHQAVSAGGAPLSLKSYEKSTIEQAMSLCDGDVLRAARMLGIGRSTLYRKMKLHGVKRCLLPNIEGTYR
jgi:two-component system response regulator HydG